MKREGANLLRVDPGVPAPAGRRGTREASDTGLQEHLLSEGASAGRDRSGFG